MAVPNQHLHSMPVKLGISGPIHLAHAASGDQGSDFVRAEARAWAEGHGKMARVYRSGPSDWLSKAHVRILSDDPVDLRGHGGGQAGREIRGGYIARLRDGAERALSSSRFGESQHCFIIATCDPWVRMIRGSTEST